MFGPCIVLQYFVFFAGEESTGCITCIVFRLLCYCSVPLLHGALGWTFLVIITCDSIALVKTVLFLKFI